MPPRFLLILLLMTVASLSCNKEKQKESHQQVFRYNESSGISSLDPAFARNLANIWAVNQLFNGLVQMDTLMQVQPCIARSWEISDNGTLYTFHLRNDVFFHHDTNFTGSKGRQVNASDFAYSFNRLLDPGLASPGSWIFSKVLVENGKPAFHAPDDSTFTIRLSEAFPPFLGILTMQYCSVVLPEAVRNAGEDFRSKPVGTGPFRLKLWKEGVKLVFERNPFYFEKENGDTLPYLDAVAITFIIDKQAAFLEFVKGNLDFMSGIDASYKDELLTSSGNLNPKHRDRIRLTSQPYLNTEYLGIFLDPLRKDDPLQIREVRQAINYGFDREKMMKYLRNNIGTPGTGGFIPQGLLGNEKHPGYHYDPDKAAALLKDAGFEGGIRGISLSTTPEYVDLCRFIQHDLSEIGMEISIDVLPAASMKEMKAHGKLPFFRGSWIADYPDAENYLSLFTTWNFTPAGPNYMHYSNPLFDRLYVDAMNTVDHTDRRKIYREMDSLLMSDAPVIVLYYDQVLRFSGSGITGLGSNPVNLLDLKRVRKKKT